AANRENAKKSTGPRSPDGKNAAKFNRLTHGLRAEQVVLPGEDPAAFEAEKQAWLNDWKPMSHTRAVLAERAATCSWMLGPATGASARLLRAYGPEEPAGPAKRTLPGAKPMPEDGPHGGPYKTEGLDAEMVSRAIAGELARLRELRAKAIDPAELRRLAVE